MKIIANKTLFYSILVILLLFLILPLIELNNLKQYSITLDEEKYIVTGKQIYQNKNWQDTLAQEYPKNTFYHPPWIFYHPPLTFYIQGLASVIWPTNNMKLTLFNARLMMLPLLIILGLLIFLLAKKMYGIMAGFLAVILYIFNPEILAHGSIIGIDFTLALTIFMATISFYFFLRKQSWKSVIIAGTFMGLAWLTKHNALLLLPLFISVFIYYLIFLNRNQPVGLIAKFIIVVFCALLTVNLAYGFRGSGQLPPSFQSSFFKNIINWPLGNVLIRVLPKAYLVGADYQYSLSQSGWITFFMGKTSWESRWDYFPLVFLIKTPLPLLFLIVIFLFFGKKEFFEWYLMYAITFFFIYMSFFNKINTGLRYLLMIYPLIILLVGGLMRSKEFLKKRLLLPLVFIFLIWYVAEFISISPHYFAYFNELIGGPAKAYLYVADSNLDFGQDNDQARRYFSEHPEIIVNPDQPTTGRLAVSVNFLNLGHSEDYWLRRLKKLPSGNLNYSWLIFDISEEDVNHL